MSVEKVYNQRKGNGDRISLCAIDLDAFDYVSG